MVILGIETSCDETSAAIIEAGDNQIRVRSNCVASSLSLHAKTGGVIPEIAAREQLKFMIPVLQEATGDAFGISPQECGISTKSHQRNIHHQHNFASLPEEQTVYPALSVLKEVDVIAITYGPGLIGSLLVGVETARTLAYVLRKPIVPVNHMIGHIYANFLNVNPKIQITNTKLPPQYMPMPRVKFPAIALVVSGGHTDLLLFRNHGDYILLGGTRDDAAGEAFDKIGRLLGLAYPAGAVIEQLAKDGDPKHFHFPRPLIGSDDFAFSFSGLKTAVLRETLKLGIKEKHKNSDKQLIKDFARATQDAIIDVLLKKTMEAVEKYHAQSLLISGGVAANQTLRNAFLVRCSESNITFFAPVKNLCTDNAAMIAAAAYYNYHPIPWQEITADPQLYFDEAVTQQ